MTADVNDPIAQRIRQAIRDQWLVVGNPSPAYTTVLAQHMAWLRQAGQGPARLDLCCSVADLRRVLVPTCEPALLVTMGHLQDGCCLSLLKELREQPLPPRMVVLLGLHDPLLPLAPLLRWPVVQLVWEGSVGKGGLAQAIEAVNRGERFVDPEAQLHLQTVLNAANTLTPREQEVLALVAEGLTNRQIAERLVVAEVTARDHVQHIIHKLAVPDRTAAAVQAMRLGLLN